MVIVQVALSIGIFMFIPVPVDRGSFGDVFEGINTLFSAFGLCRCDGVIILQSKELLLQRIELELAKKELTKFAEVQNEQTMA